MKVLNNRQLSQVLLILFSMLLFSACSQDNETPRSLLAKTKAGFQTPEISFQDINGTRYTTTDLQGKAVVINFWATWCPPCRAEMPSMNRAWSKLKEHDVKMFAVNVAEPPEEIEVFTKEIPIHFPIILDPNAKISQEWKVRGMPTTYILNAQGETVYTIVGEREWDDPEIINAIKALAKR